MKEDIYTSLICKKFCSYYKPGKETETCGGYDYIQQYLTPSELNSVLKIYNLNKDILSSHSASFLCEKCSFKEDGCDFFVNKSSNPCGGYSIIIGLLNHTNF
ncbi:hypothetical protein [Thermodesulfovibrio hydrogeniphilus]